MTMHLPPSEVAGKIDYAWAGDSRCPYWFEEFRRFLDKVQIMPPFASWNLHILARGTNCEADVSFIITTLDTNPPHGRVQIAHVFSWDVCYEVDWQDLFYTALRSILLHELNESYLVDGTRVHDPHADTTRAPVLTGWPSLHAPPRRPARDYLTLPRARRPA